MKSAVLLTFLLLGAAPKISVNDEAPKFENIEELKPKLRVVTDGKGHYLAMDPTGSFHGPFFYGDGKTFYALRSSGGGASGTERFNASLWDPRIDFRLGYASFDFADGKYSVSCPPRTTGMTVVPLEDSKKLIASATFFDSRWRRLPHKLVRDDQGNYYFVDCARDGASIECERDWRLYVGPRGKLKLQQMTNIVADSVGQIFATKSGELRLVLDSELVPEAELTGKKDKSIKWVNGKTVTPLVDVPMETNSRMIYSDLGVYDRERLGTPCDDL